jgi:hypothetical protein
MMNPSSDIEVKTREVERYLYRLGDNIERASRGNDETLENLNCQLEIYEAGAWIVKFRSPSRVIINNTETILTDSLKIDATIGFTSSGSFWATVNGNLSLDSSAANFSGGDEALQYFRHKIFSSTDKPSPSLGNGAAMSTKSTSRAYINNSHAEDEAMTTQPLKSGWMLKKKEIMRGWNSRYFRVYVGRFEYFMDPNDESPRAVIPLLDAKVSALPKEIKVRGYDMHYQIMIEPKYHEKSFRLASERGGSAGQTEIQSWQAAFNIASKPADVAITLIKAAREKNLLQQDGDDTRDGQAAGGAASSGDGPRGARGGSNGGAGSGGPIVSAVRRFSASAAAGMGDDSKGQMPAAVPIAGAVAALVLLVAAVYSGQITVGGSWNNVAGLTWVTLSMCAIAAGILGAQIAYRTINGEPTGVSKQRSHISVGRSRTNTGGGRRSSSSVRGGDSFNTPGKNISIGSGESSPSDGVWRSVRSDHGDD